MTQNTKTNKPIIVGIAIGAVIAALGFSAANFLKEQPKPQQASDTKRTQATEYKRYCNPRFGFCISHPTNLQEDPSPDNGDGQIFRDQNGLVLIASGMNNIMEETIDTGIQSAAGNFDNITYKAKGDNWFVISGTKGNKIIYKKTFLGKNAENNLHIEYPGNLSSEYNELINNISKSFKPGEIN